MEPTPYVLSAQRYLDAGWSPIPMKPNDAETPKGRPHHGVTGYAGAVISPELLRSFLTGPDVEKYPNVSARMVGSAGLDLDAYDGRQGYITFKLAQVQLGLLPATFYTTARGAGASGIRIYRLPDGFTDLMLLGEADTICTIGSGIEVIRYGCRYAKCWPTVHPNGNAYRWHHEDGRGLAEDFIPELTDCPELPLRWAEFLTTKPAPVKRIAGQRAGGRENSGLSAAGTYAGGTANGGHIGQTIETLQDNTIAAYAAHLAGKHNAEVAGFDYEKCLELLGQRAENCVVRTFTDTELRRKLDNAIEKFKDHRTEEEKHEDQRAYRESLIVTGDVNPFSDGLDLEAHMALNGPLQCPGGACGWTWVGGRRIVTTTTVTRTTTYPTTWTQKDVTP